MFYKFRRFHFRKIKLFVQNASVPLPISRDAGLGYVIFHYDWVRIERNIQNMMKYKIQKIVLFPSAFAKMETKKSP